MTAQDAASAAGPPPVSRARHGLRIFLIWFPVALAVDLVIWYVWYPHLPPGRMSSSASGQQLDIAVLAISGAPELLLVWAFFGYSLVVWRQRRGDPGDGPHLTGNRFWTNMWISKSALIVLWLVAFGTLELIIPAGAGGGEGPAPAWPMAGTQTATWHPGGNDMLQVQVIGQQWYFTYRYPQFGGMETTQLLLPDNTPVEFHVTSLDVIHSFWAFLLGVKADANPMVDDVAYTKPDQLGSFTVRCAELCGIWHGDMNNPGAVMTPTAFRAWAVGAEAKERSSGLLAALPPYSTTYNPNAIPQLGKAFQQLGITGADGGYYPPADSATGPSQG